MDSLELEAYAKINLGLRVLGKCPDGYHEIDTVLLSLDLADRLTLQTRPEGGITLEMAPDREIPPEGNLAYRAARLLKERVGFEQGVKIRLVKRIPIGAGLGGGSSDAAAVLGGLNELLRLGLDRGELMELGMELGSDVPFFFFGGRCRARGRGEILERIDDLPREHFVLLIPPFPLDTREVYGAWDRLEPSQKLDSPYPNDLEGTALRLAPELRRYREFLVHEGVPFGLSGSGPTYYASFRDEGQAHRFSQKAERELRCRAVICRPTHRGYAIIPRLG